MPKIVDPEERRKAVVDAVFRVVRRDGVEAASLRNIATEAGLAIGSVRHYFTSHEELMVFAMKEMVERVSARVLAHAEALRRPAPVRDRAARAEALLREFLPVDDERFDETVVWLEFVKAARTRPSLQPEAKRLHDGMRMIVGKVLSEAHRNGRLREGLDLGIETEHLAALLDGLAMAAVLQPWSFTPERAVDVLHAHLGTLTETGLPF
ncbi:TetR/AcrR family transcriptional regulator [Phytomonospora endophytica]|uniref:AcrR family transcriptional regulator n=1 Tax=Phytomonospora endophytica TaxID=714109 RepID=A0A841FHW0_9ACTN|nr:TetR family transcriptional regulator C-terminal domain-containing protein [Phytomonospora endophytica]MBB6033438.1 AcrR family transcriptional regulator [Phytomonospora endophytica]GIG70789.1 TetR family transcriptional regulator [Phytomonospora endophytica]